MVEHFQRLLLDTSPHPPAFRDVASSCCVLLHFALQAEKAKVARLQGTLSVERECSAKNRREHRAELLSAEARQIALEAQTELHDSRTSTATNLRSWTWSLGGRPRQVHVIVQTMSLGPDINFPILGAEIIRPASMCEFRKIRGPNMTPNGWALMIKIRTRRDSYIRYNAQN